MISSVFIIIYFVLFFLALAELRNDQKGNAGVYYFIIAILILVGGFRYYQGADYPIYVDLFYGSQFYIDWDSITNGPVEASYIIISKIIGQILQLPFYWVTFTYALISLSLKGNFFYTFSPYPFLSLLMFYMPVMFFEDFGQIRQGASIAFCAFSYRYIVKRQLIFFLLAIAMAFFFHKSAIVFLLAYWIAPLKIGTNMALFAIVLSILLWPFEVYRILGPLLDTFTTDSISDSYSGYINDNYYGVELKYGKSDVIKFIWLVIIFMADRKLLHVGYKYLYPRNLTLFFFIIFFLCRGNSILAVRLPGAYSFFLYLLIPTIIFYAGYNLRRLISYYVFIFSFAIMINFQDTALKGGFGKFRNVLFMKNPKFKNNAF